MGSSALDRLRVEVRGPRLRDFLGLGFRVWGLGFRVWGLGGFCLRSGFCIEFGLYVLGWFRVPDTGCRVFFNLGVMAVI